MDASDRVSDGNLHYVCIDSRDRDVSLFPDPSSYVVPFSSTLLSVLDVELVYAQYTILQSSTDSVGRYIVLVIDECSPNNVVSNASRLPADAFTCLPTTGSSGSGLLEYSSRSTFRSVKRFAPPRAKLDRLSLRFFGADGRPAAGVLGEHMLRFEVRAAPYRQDLVDRGDVDTRDKIARVLLKLNRRLLAMQEHQDHQQASKDQGPGLEAFSTGTGIEAVEGDDDARRTWLNKRTALGVGATVLLAAGGVALHRRLRLKD